MAQGMKTCKCLSVPGPGYWLKSCPSPGPTCNNCCPNGGFLSSDSTMTIGNGRSTIRNRRSAPVRSRGYMRRY